jgi:DNA/RNA-binding domain of Phe-tRNA-synthetase-like protein
MRVDIDPDLSRQLSSVRLGSLEWSVEGTFQSDALSVALEESASPIRHAPSAESLLGRRELSTLREAYAKLGKSPSRYRGSAEALVRRLLKGEQVPSIHPIVDLNNLISLHALLPVGSYDAAKLRGGAVRFRRGSEGEEYEAKGKALRLVGLPVFADDGGPFGSATSDSLRTRIGESTVRVLTLIICFDERVDLDRVVGEAERRIREFVTCVIHQAAVVE